MFADFDVTSCQFRSPDYLEFFDDLLNVLQSLIQSGDLTNRESLHCDVLNIDPLNFYSQLYKMLPRLHAGMHNDDILIVLRCLDAMLTRRKKQVTLQRAMAFVKRLSTLSLHVLPNATVGLLAANRSTMHAFPKCDFLLDNEVQGSGFYLPELDEPEHCNAQNTALWNYTLYRYEYTLYTYFVLYTYQYTLYMPYMLYTYYTLYMYRYTLYMPYMLYTYQYTLYTYQYTLYTLYMYQYMLYEYQDFYEYNEGSAALNVDLSRRSPAELFNVYSVKNMTFNPPVALPGTKKKDRFVGGAMLLDMELQRRAESAMTAIGEAELDFNKHKHTTH
ncbi:Nucleolar complex protein 3-like protein [Larimichthys crocea]|uniref:Nucleolar complex protein 3-like protein n=1 Tax=Larimichthys crocea TaxID=215358 RepID=A0A6G0HX00_LARCR|nr:Nucleolar complex protein 3-like protein [Larimichthys crocea]